MTATIILLNGVGSSGKSSIARALQAMLAAPYLHVQTNAFLDMLPDRYHEHPDGFTYEAERDAGKPVVEIRAGRMAARALRGMRRGIAAMAREGNDLIVDDIMCNGEMPEYRALLMDFRLFVVGVFASLEILEARERLRGDRMIGLARWQYDRVHCGIEYDVRVDTETMTPLECASRIKDSFGL